MCVNASVRVCERVLVCVSFVLVCVSVCVSMKKEFTRETDIKSLLVRDKERERERECVLV